MTTREDVMGEIETAFSEFVDETTDVSKRLVEIAKEENYQIKKTREKFTDYLTGEGAEGDALTNMVEAGIKMLKEQINPNKAILYPRAADKPADKPAAAEKPAEKPTVAAAKKTTLSKKATPAPAPADDEEPADDEPAATAESSGSSKSSPSKSGTKKKEGPKRIYGFNLYTASISEELKKLHPDNPTARSKEAGVRWEKFQKEHPADAAKFNADARLATEASGYTAPPSKKTAKAASEKRPLQARQAFHSDQFEKYSQIYRKTHKLGKDETVPPKEVMKLTAEAWGKLSDKEKAKFQAMADEQNEREGRHNKEKGKTADETKATSAYRMFCDQYREDHPKEEGGSYFLRADEMNKEWHSIKEENGALFKEWTERAKEENERREKLRAAAPAAATSTA